jgi:Ala-tRNA(Pro) deacylase
LLNEFRIELRNKFGKEFSMTIEKLKDYLDSHNVKYVVISHSLAYTSQDIAHSAHIPTNLLAKTVVVKIDGKLCMVVLPVSHRVDLHLLKEVIGVKKVELATEDEFSGIFQGCEVGAMPPFGNLYGMDVFVSGLLSEEAEIAFNACSHRELIKRNADGSLWRRHYVDDISEKTGNPHIVSRTCRGVEGTTSGSAEVERFPCGV